MLNFETAVYHRVEYHEFDAIVAEHLGFEDYEVVAHQEWCNDQQHIFDNITHPARFAYSQKSIQRVLDGERDARFNSAPSPDILLGALVAMDIIPPGNYIISVCW